MFNVLDLWYVQKLLDQTHYILSHAKLIEMLNERIHTSCVEILSDA